MPKSVPISVRISDDDAAFLARYEAPGANTPSEKLRAILASARERHEGARDFAGCANLVANMLRPAIEDVRRSQRKVGMRSDFVSRLYERLPELLGEMMVAAPEAGNEREALLDLEAVLADQIFSLFEEILDMGLTSRSRSYDPALVRERLSPALEILDLIKLKEQSKGEAK